MTELRLRPLREDDETQAHAELAAEKFTFLLEALLLRGADRHRPFSGPLGQGEV